ncbi:7-cyano-7-deazaguanine synthase [Caldalkalibacillus thermarum]|uniref:7-cyano-7-deazaguanine synthase QueC n=1 Tax=Caldalkalibacillus thermarum TaxID=296745 RepID=UPI0016651F21|nr:7-cyano-7-deazaguanine synthase QueC [Caldalkalibacillus thermarum]GGK20193.1 7-cyano-7-deazaguanine synthase [Caldalkalibacillus thermarum]
MSKKAVIVLSGGLDSTTCMGIAHDQGYALYPLTFHYGQRHSREVEQAKKIAQYYQAADHRIVNIRFLRDIGGSALTDDAIDVPDQGEDGSIPVTYVPARNLIFLSLAAAYAEVVGAEKIMIGVSAVDYSGYPDCRPEFIESLSRTIQLGTKAGVEGKAISIDAPLVHLSKAETIAWGMKLGVPYHLTTSCYKGREVACGQCDSCRLRIKGFKEAGYRDPLPYAISIDW